MRQFSESVTDVMRYIVQVEMGGKVDEDSHLYPTYLDLKDLLWQVKDNEDVLDENTQTLIPAYKPEPLVDIRPLHSDTSDEKRWDNKDFDVDMSKDMWDN